MTLPLVYRQKATIDNHIALYSITVQFLLSNFSDWQRESFLLILCQVLFVIYEFCIITALNLMAEKELNTNR